MESLDNNPQADVSGDRESGTKTVQAKVNCTSHPWMVKFTCLVQRKVIGV
ncbi:MAG: hypothetical protein IPJ39_16670 [Saprospiraceae bacterium]|nr:hypothetical protein [Saprospiraceae bacterium]